MTSIKLILFIKSPFNSLQRSSLWIRQLATSASQQIIPPAEVQYFALTFTPDGKYIYYVTRADRTLYRVSLLGGPSKKVLEKAGRGVSFSPDGSQFVFQRHLLDRRQVAMFVADADGSDVKEVAAIDYPESFEYPAWSPDGQLIACAAGHSWGGKHLYIVVMRVGEWNLKPVSAGSNPKNLLGDLTGRVTAGLGTVTPDGRYILYYSDLNGGVRHIWRMDIDGGNPIQLTNGTGEDRPACSPDGRWVVYTSLDSKGRERPTLWKVSIDGGAPVQLTDEWTNGPSVSPDGKLIACLYSEAGNWEGKLAVFLLSLLTPAALHVTLRYGCRNAYGFDYPFYRNIEVRVTLQLTNSDSLRNEFWRRTHVIALLGTL